MKRAALCLVAATIAVAAVVVGELAARARWAGTAVETSFYSKAVRGRVHLSVYLPAGYESGHTRYPVVYFLHGLPAGSRTYEGFDFLRSALDAVGKPAILVAAQGARDGDSDPEYLDWGPGRNWETAAGLELPRFVDAHYRTIRSRLGRAIVGLSAGGYGATILALHHSTRSRSSSPGAATSTRPTPRGRGRSTSAPPARTRARALTRT